MFRRYALAVAVTLLIVGVVAVPASAAKKETPMQFCQDDFKRLCFTGAPGQRDTDLWKCLRDTLEKVENEKCRHFVRGILACEDDAKKTPNCLTPAENYAVSLRRCLRQLGPDEVSPECRETEMYERIAEARRHAEEVEAQAKAQAEAEEQKAL